MHNVLSTCMHGKKEGDVPTQPHVTSAELLRHQLHLRKRARFSIREAFKLRLLCLQQLLSSPLAVKCHHHQIQASEKKLCSHQPTS